jgi:uncharacterized protein (TIGR01777 family)
VRVAVTGASGLVGRAVVAALRERGDAVVAVGRRGPVAWDPESGPPPPEVTGAEAIVHLAGEPIATKRWSAAQKRRIRDSRVVGTRNLVEAINRAGARPRVLVSASGIHYYGDDRGDEVLDEGSSAGAGFLAGVCLAWEAEAARAETRVVRLRTGIVLAREGGALPPLALPFRLFVGGPLGSGRQWMSWIHVDDHVGLILRAIDDDGVRGPVNAVAPSPVRNAQMARSLGRVLGRPALFPAPRLALALLLGERATLLLGSLRVRSAAGGAFRFPELEPALRALLHR